MPPKAAEKKTNDLENGQYRNKRIQQKEDSSLQPSDLCSFSHAAFVVCRIINFYFLLVQTRFFLRLVGETARVFSYALSHQFRFF